jgi:hypothetical protein
MEQPFVTTDESTRASVLALAREALTQDEIRAAAEVAVIS